MRFLNLDFLPRGPDFALLFLRLTFGLSLLILHGWDKFAHMSAYSTQFVALFGLTAATTLKLSIAAELVGSALVVLGLWTRLGALIVSVNLGVAFFLVHKGALSGPASGEMALIYLAGFFSLFLTGGGRYSFDSPSGA